jgi:hypothetical protein
VQHPGNELPVWKDRPDETEHEVNRLRLHSGNLADARPSMSNAGVSSPGLQSMSVGETHAERRRPVPGW